MASGIELLRGRSKKSAFDLLSDKQTAYNFDLTDRAQPWMDSIGKAEEKYGLPKNLLANVIQTESAFDPEAKSPVGATGIAQIMPEYHPDVDPTDPEASIDYGASYLKKLYNRFGDWDKALAAYNTGPGNVDKLGMDNLPEETRNYLEKINAAKVQDIREELRSGDGASSGLNLLQGGQVATTAPVTDVPSVSGIAKELRAEELRKKEIGEGTIQGAYMKELVAPGKEEWDVKEADFVSEEDKQGFVDTVGGLAELVGQPYDVAKGLAEFAIHGIPSFMMGLGFATERLFKKGIPKFASGGTVMDAYEEAAKGFEQAARLAEPAREQLEESLEAPRDLVRRAIGDKATDYLLGLPEDVDTRLVGEVGMAPATGTMAVGHKLADQFENHPNVKGLLYFASDAAGLAALGKVYHGGREKLVADSKAFEAKARDIVRKTEVIEKLPDERVKAAQQRAAEIEKIQLDLEAKEMMNNLDYGEMIKEDLSKTYGRLRQVKQPKREVLDEQVDRAMQKLPEPTVEEFRGPGAKGEAAVAEAVSEIRKGLKDRPKIERTKEEPTKPAERLTGRKLRFTEEEIGFEIPKGTELEVLAEPKKGVYTFEWEGKRVNIDAFDPRNEVRLIEPTAEPTRKGPRKVEFKGDIKKEANEIFDTLELGPEYKRMKKFRVEEQVVEPGEPIDIPSTWHDAAYRLTVARDAEGNLQVGRGGSYDTILSEGHVAGAKKGAIPPGHTLYVLDIGGEGTVAQTRTLRIYRAKPSKEVPTQIEAPTPVERPTELYDLGGAIGEAAKSTFNRLTGRDKVKVNEQPPDPFEGVREDVKELVFARRAGLDLASYDTNKFVNSLEQQTTKAQRQVMPFVIEGTGFPKELNRPDLEKVFNRDRDYLKGVAEDVKKHFDEGWRKIKKHIPDLTVKQIEDYVTHLWDIPRHKKAEAISWFQTQNRFLERRFIPTYKEGIEKGFRPKTLDISEIIKVHDNVSNRAIENVKYLNALLKMKRDGISLINRSDEAPLDWVEVDYPALTRRIPLKRTQIKRKGEFVKELKVRVHPDLVRPLKAIFEERFDHPVISAYEAIGGVMKKSMLTLSLFHHGALGETGLALMGPTKTLNIMFNPVKVYNGLAKDKLDVFEKEPIARDSIKHGVQYGATADIPVGRIQKYLDQLAQATEHAPLINKLTKFSAGANSLWDKALWTYLHDTLKLYGYESLVGKLDSKLSAEGTKAAKMEIAQVVNDTFGGQNWDTLMMTPKEVQMLTWSLLSADWTLSTTRQALAPTGVGKIYKETAGLRKKLGAMYWLRAALYFGIGMNLLNALYRSRDMKENPQYYEDKDYSFFDRTMFGNTVGKRTYLFKGRYEDGSERYVRWGKQFRDFFELLIHPVQKIGGKIAPVPQLISDLFTGHTLSGFKDDDIYGTKGLEYATEAIQKIGGAFLPLSFRRMLRDNIEFKPLDIVMRSSKGMTRYAAKEYYKEAIVSGDEDLLRDTYVGALRNNLPAYTLFNSALGWVEGEIMSELSRDVKSIEEAETKLRMATSPYERRRYGKIVRRLRREEAEKKNALKVIDSVISKHRELRRLGHGRSENKSGDRQPWEDLRFE